MGRVALSMLGLLFVLLICLKELKTPGDGVLALF